MASVGFWSLQADALFVRLDERKEPLCNWLRTFVVRFVTSIQYRKTLSII
jgi:hypothetical protein